MLLDGGRGAASSRLLGGGREEADGALQRADDASARALVLMLLLLLGVGVQPELPDAGVAAGGRLGAVGEAKVVILGARKSRSAKKASKPRRNLKNRGYLDWSDERSRFRGGFNSRFRRGVLK